MTIQEIKTLSRVLKIMIPVVKEPETEDEWRVIASMFNNLNYDIAIKALNRALNIEYCVTPEQKLEYDKVLKEIKQMPYLTLKKIVVKATEFDDVQKKKYLNESVHYFIVDTLHNKMLAVNKGTGTRNPKLDRDMTPLEKSFWVDNEMDLETYQKNKLLQGFKSY